MKSQVPLQVVFIASLITAFFFALSMVLPLSNDKVGAPDLPVVIGFLVTVVIGVSMGSWMALKGETVRSFPLLVSLLVTLGLVLLLCLLFGMALELSSPAWREFHPSAVFNLSVTANILFVLTCSLAVEAAVVLVSIIRHRREQLR